MDLYVANNGEVWWINRDTSMRIGVNRWYAWKMRSRPCEIWNGQLIDTTALRFWNNAFNRQCDHHCNYLSIPENSYSTAAYNRFHQTHRNTLSFLNKWIKIPYILRAKVRYCCRTNSSISNWQIVSSKYIKYRNITYFISLSKRKRQLIIFSKNNRIIFLSTCDFISTKMKKHLSKRKIFDDIGLVVALICINLKSTKSQFTQYFDDNPRNYNCVSFTRHLRNRNNSLESTQVLSVSATLFKITTRHGSSFSTNLFSDSPLPVSRHVSCPRPTTALLSPPLC